MKYTDGCSTNLVGAILIKRSGSIFFVKMLPYTDKISALRKGRFSGVVW